MTLAQSILCGGALTRCCAVQWVHPRLCRSMLALL